MEYISGKNAGQKGKVERNRLRCLQRPNQSSTSRVSLRRLDTNKPEGTEADEIDQESCEIEDREAAEYGGAAVDDEDV